MGNGPILQGKRAVVFGAAGSLGAAVAKEFAPKALRSSWPDGPSPTWKLWPNKSRAAAGERSGR